MLQYIYLCLKCCSSTSKNINGDSSKEKVFIIKNEIKALKYLEEFFDQIESNRRSEKSDELLLSRKKHEIWNDIMFMSKLKHKNISKFIALIDNDGEFLVCCERGNCTLDKYLEEDHDKWKLTEQLLKGVCYIHSQNVALNNIAANNIYVKDDGTVLIYNFKTAKDFSKESIRKDLKRSSIKMESIYTHKNRYIQDIRSLGNIIKDIFGSKNFYLWKYKTKEQKNISIENNPTSTLADKNSGIKENEKIFELISSCFTLDSNKIPSSAELLDSFKKIKHK